MAAITETGSLRLLDEDLVHDPQRVEKLHCEPAPYAWSAAGWQDRISRRLHRSLLHLFRLPGIEGWAAQEHSLPIDPGALQDTAIVSAMSEFADKLSDCSIAALISTRPDGSLPTTAKNLPDSAAAGEFCPFQC